MDAPQDRTQAGNRPQTAPPPRLGPRPLPLHLGIATMACLSSTSALGSLNESSGSWSESSKSWSEGLRTRAESLRKNLRNVDASALRAEVEAEARDRLKRFLLAVDGYRHHPYRRALQDPPPIWLEGATRLLDYGACPEASDPEGTPILIVPSMVNRGYVLDLMPGRSLLRDLAARGYRPFLVEWGAPGPAERGLGLDDFILGRLGDCIEAVRAATGRRPVLAGYCMGGTLVAALAQHRPGEVRGLALLAAPWDFHADGGTQARTIARLMGPSFALYEQLGEVPVDVLQMLFASLDPLLALKKFNAFSRFAPDSSRAEAFVALEDWLNDGIALPVKVAWDCIMGWYGENRPGRGEWSVGGQAVRPGTLDLPALAIVPAQDRIVPPASAAALAKTIPGAKIRRPRAGHIGMVVGGKRATQLTGPLVAWLETLPD